MDWKNEPRFYTGMLWSTIRCNPTEQCGTANSGYHIPSNIYSAGGLQRILELNSLIWKNNELESKARKILYEIEEGIARYGIRTRENWGTTTIEYANVLDETGFPGADLFNDPIIPSLLSIPLLGWSKYNKTAYEIKRRSILSNTNPDFVTGKSFSGLQYNTIFPIPIGMAEQVSPMNFAVRALTAATLSTANDDSITANILAYEIKQSIRSWCNGTVQDQIDSEIGCDFLHTMTSSSNNSTGEESCNTLSRPPRTGWTSAMFITFV